MNATTSLSSGLLCVRYRRLGDRLAHEIGTIDGDSFYPVLESIEGTPVDAWPASPPMQQIVEESIGASLSPVLLGVGLSGNGHWSIAIESQNASSLKFDVACRNRLSGSDRNIVSRPNGLSRMRLFLKSN